MTKLTFLGCINPENFKITNIGKFLLSIPLEFIYGRCLIESVFNKCTFNLLYAFSLLNTLGSGRFLNLNKWVQVVLGNIKPRGGDLIVIQKCLQVLKTTPKFINIYFCRRINLQKK